MGVMFEAQAHKTLYEKFRTGGDLTLTRMYPTTCQRTATEEDVEALRIIVNRKVFIRTIEDIALLKENEYGLPIISNFSLVDAVIKARYPGQPKCGVELQVTISKTHKGALSKHPDIEQNMGTPSASNKMIFCCCEKNFDDLGYVNGLVPDVKQYKMLCEWVAGADSKKRKSLSGEEDSGK